MNKDSISREERDTMKIVVLSILYGSEGNSAARTLHISEEAAKALVDKFMLSFPEIAQFQSNAYAYTVKHGYVQSFYFRPRILKEDPVNNDASRKRQCVNSAIQNTCADALKICISQLDPMSKVKFVTTVFDSVLFEVPTDFTEDEAKDFLKHFFSYSSPFNFRFEYAMGNTWGEAQEKM
jgi:DNA polymerase I-like protein with 3'-5' exonuclease and polymerase domains